MSRPFVDRPVTDRAAADRAALEASTRWHLPAPHPIRYGMNAVYLAGDAVLRVATPTAPGGVLLDAVSTLARCGIPTPISARPDALSVDGYTITAWRRLPAVDRPVDWREVGAVVRTLHQLAPDELPGGFPLAEPRGLPWWDFDALLEEATGIDQRAREGLRSVVDRDAIWLEPSMWEEVQQRAVVCHGDVVPPNVTMTEDGPVLVDFDLMSLAPPGWDHGPLLTWASRWGGDEHAYDAFAEGYGTSLRADPAAVAFGRLRLVAATLLRAKAAHTDAAARRELERRLHYWRGEPDPPPWQLA